MEISSLLFIDTIEKQFAQEIASNNDFQLGSVEPERIINLFNQSSTLFINWYNGDSVQPERLTSLFVQEIPHKGKGCAFNLILQNQDRKENIIALIRDKETLESEAKEAFEFLKVFTLLALEATLPETTKLESNPTELLHQLKPPRRALPEGEGAQAPVEEAPAEA